MTKNLALVGCGAIAQTFYLPAIANVRSRFRRVWLVDPNQKARAQAKSMLDGEMSDTLSNVDDDLEYVIVATPNASHFSVAQEALSRGANVLVDKPFVIWPVEGRKLIEQARRNRAVFSVNQTRRLYPNAGEIRNVITTQNLGKLLSITHNEGVKVDWPYQSGAAFAKDAKRTGVLIDFGSHVLDFYQYLLEPTWKFVACKHDGFRGPEGLAEIKLEANDAPVFVKFSRYYMQKNTGVIRFRNAEITFDVFDWNSYYIEDERGKNQVITSTKVVSYAEFADQLLRNFIGSVERMETPICEGSSSLPIIELLDTAYRQARHYPDQIGAV